MGSCPVICDCLGNVHLLPYVVQCGTVEALRRLENQFGYENASALLFVSGQMNQMLTTALNGNRIRDQKSEAQNEKTVKKQK